MARVPLLDHEQLAPEDRELIWRRGNLYKALANSPEFTARFASFGFYMNCASQIPLRMQEVVILTVASLTKSKFEWVAHVKKSIDLQLLTDDEIRALKSGETVAVGSFTPAERGAATIARELVQTGHVSDDNYASMRAEFSDGYIVELAGLIAMYLGLAHVISMIQVEVEKDHLHWLDAFPL